MMNDPMESELPTFRCDDCETLWGGDPDTYPCEFQDGCDVICCEDCYTECYSCDITLCSRHRIKADCGDGEQWYCAGCLAADREQEPAA